MEYEIFTSGEAVRVIDSGTVSGAGTVNGNWIDTMGFDAFVANLRVVGTAGQITAIGANISELASHSDSVADTGAQVLVYPLALPLNAAASPGASLRIGLVTKPRYFQLVFTVAATPSGTSLVISGDGELNASKTKPANLNASALQASQINDPGNIVSGTTTYVANPPLRNQNQ